MLLSDSRVILDKDVFLMAIRNGNEICINKILFETNLISDYAIDKNKDIKEKIAIQSIILEDYEALNACRKYFEYKFAR